jgi:hypothetical protein
MTEPIRTVIYVGIAAVIGLAAWATRPSVDSGPGILDETGQPLFPAFKDPDVARSLEIVQFDETTAELRTFKVAQKNGLWVIPSHDDYPADAQQQLADAASSLLNLEIVGIASEVQADWDDCKVIEPGTKLAVGDKDVGTLVVLQDAKNDDLVRLIVGDAVPDRPELRFVRKPGQEVTYVTKLSLDKLPTEFDKWIEKDLLKLNTFDVARVNLKDYSILPTESGRPVISPRMEAVAAWNSEKSEWTLDDMRLFSTASSEWVATPLGEQEELNTQKLNDLKNALDDLKIVDVNRKPPGLREKLKEGGDLTADRELFAALVSFGFWPGTAPGTNKPEVFAANGEVVVDMKDGVQYHLRFGNVAGAQTGTSSADPGAADKDEVKLNRHLFVTAALSPHTLVEPKYEPEPAGPAPIDARPAEAEKKDDATKTDETKADAAKTDPKADEKKPDAAADPQAAERDRIKRENDRKRNEYNEKKKKAEARVAELNARFADWYYVISEDVYKKIHLGRNDLVKEGATARDAGYNVDAFRKLETEGIKPAPPAPPSTPGFGAPGGFPM